MAVDKGALCLVMSAFDTLPEAQFKEFVPFLSVILNKGRPALGCLAITSVTPWAAVQALGLLKEKFISKWQTVCIITGLLLLNNPDIEFISAVGALLMCAGYIPWGIKILQGRMKCSSNSLPIIDKINKDFKCKQPCGCCWKHRNVIWKK